MFEMVSTRPSTAVRVCFLLLFLILFKTPFVSSIMRLYLVSACAVVVLGFVVIVVLGFVVVVVLGFVVVMLWYNEHDDDVPLLSGQQYVF